MFIFLKSFRSFPHFLFGTIIITFFLLSLVTPRGAYAATMEAATTLTLLNVTQWEGASSKHEDYTVDTLLYNTNYHTGGMSWSSDPYPRRWGQTLPNGVTGFLWAIRPIDAAGTQFKALSWDYVGNDTSGKHCCSSGPPGIVFTMLSSLCDVASGACATPQRVRTNIVRFPEINFTSTGPIDIKPKHAGAFVNGADPVDFTAYINGVAVPDSQVDWYITEYDPVPGQPVQTPEQIATIDKEGKVTVVGTFGRVKVNVCYPKGCGPNGGDISGARHLLLRPIRR